MNAYTVRKRKFVERTAVVNDRSPVVVFHDEPVFPHFGNLSYIPVENSGSSSLGTESSAPLQLIIVRYLHHSVSDAEFYVFIN